jgi:hypothetical protein
MDLVGNLDLKSNIQVLKNARVSHRVLQPVGVGAKKASKGY